MNATTISMQENSGRRPMRPAVVSNHGEAELRGWITGFVDGKGAFDIGFPRTQEPDRSRPWLRYAISPRFTVTQGIRAIGCLEFLRDYFDAGTVLIDRCRADRRGHLGVYRVDQLRDLVDVIVPFFTRNPLQTSKYLDLIRFSQCLQLIDEGRHESLCGYMKILDIAEAINGSEPQSEVRRFVAVSGCTV